MDLPPPTPSHHSATFEERGVSMPFTTPTLSGARVRRDARHGLAMVVPNPSGGRGVYVLPWSGVRDMCHPTLHDSMLHDAIAGARAALTPGTVRAAARQVALDGAAGRAAHAAAVQAMRLDADLVHAANSYLLSALAPLRTVTADLAEVGALARVAAEIGIGPDAGRSPIPTRLNRLRQLQEELADWSQRSLDGTGLAAMATSLAEVSVRCTERVLADARAMLGDVGPLLTQWQARPEEVVALLGRAGWVLDGWDMPCLLWRAASGEAARRLAIIEIGQMLTVLPQEAGQWLGMAIDTEAGQAVRRMGGLQDWRTGLGLLEIVARNEQFRALAA